MGISSEIIEENSERIVLKTGRCPIYKATQAVGMDNEGIEVECQANAIYYKDVMLKQWDPNLSYRLWEFRSSADAHCIEEVVLG
ncbi:hypothetical protein ADN00_18010 [Ornatilinea apprima]|uniref:Uncharacterized protein n=1 Tax=Ornatilinea apprima TaxID=1134406 RepID=A0A0P6WPS0_9CHLR|nr:hypothetical protein [Ornatilinea apprima]KPL70771.1 hypothetical protein ADN00_18010 [Ornatilinea apprima]